MASKSTSRDSESGGATKTSSSSSTASAGYDLKLECLTTMTLGEYISGSPLAKALRSTKHLNKIVKEAMIRCFGTRPDASHKKPKPSPAVFVCHRKIVLKETNERKILDDMRTELEVRRAPRNRDEMVRFVSMLYDEGNAKVNDALDLEPLLADARGETFRKRIESIVRREMSPTIEQSEIDQHVRKILDAPSKEDVATKMRGLYMKYKGALDGAKKDALEYQRICEALRKHVRDVEPRPEWVLQCHRCIGRTMVPHAKEDNEWDLYTLGKVMCAFLPEDHLKQPFREIVKDKRKGEPLAVLLTRILHTIQLRNIRAHYTDEQWEPPSTRESLRCLQDVAKVLWVFGCSDEEVNTAKKLFEDTRRIATRNKKGTQFTKTISRKDCAELGMYRMLGEFESLLKDFELEHKFENGNLNWPDAPLLPASKQPVKNAIKRVKNERKRIWEARGWLHHDVDGPPPDFVAVAKDMRIVLEALPGVSADKFRPWDAAFAEIESLDEVEMRLHYQADAMRIPRPRERCFVGRSDLIKRIETRLMAKLGTRILVYGVPGIGKDTLAAEIVHRESIRDASKDLLIQGWIIASTDADFEMMIYDLFNAVLPEVVEAAKGNRKKALVRIKQWLKKNDQWLLVIEDLPNTSNILREWFPSTQTKGGHLLVTSQTDTHGYAFTATECVEKLSRVECLELWEEKLRIDETVGKREVKDSADYTAALKRAEKLRKDSEKKKKIAERVEKMGEAIQVLKKYEAKLKSECLQVEAKLISECLDVEAKLRSKPIQADVKKELERRYAFCDRLFGTASSSAPTATATLEERRDHLIKEFRSRKDRIKLLRERICGATRLRQSNILKYLSGSDSGDLGGIPIDVVTVGRILKIDTTLTVDDFLKKVKDRSVLISSMHRKGFDTKGNTRSYGVLWSIKLQIQRLRAIVERRERYDNESYLNTLEEEEEDVDMVPRPSSPPNAESSVTSSVYFGDDEDVQAYLDCVEARFRRAIGVLSAMTVLPPQRAPVKLFCGNAPMVKTPYGEGKVLERRWNGIDVVELKKWKLADDKPVTMFYKNKVETPFGKGEILERREDGVLVVRVAQSDDGSKSPCSTTTRTVYWDPSFSRVDVRRACFEEAGEIDDARRDLVEAGLLQRSDDPTYLGRMHQRMQEMIREVLFERMREKDKNVSVSTSAATKTSSRSEGRRYVRPETRKIAGNAHAALVDTIDRRFGDGHGREALDEDKLLAPCVEHLFGGKTIVEGLQAEEIERMDEKNCLFERHIVALRSLALFYLRTVGNPSKALEFAKRGRDLCAKRVPIGSMPKDEASQKIILLHADCVFTYAEALGNLGRGKEARDLYKSALKDLLLWNEDSFEKENVSSMRFGGDDSEGASKDGGSASEESGVWCTRLKKKRLQSVSVYLNNLGGAHYDLGDYDSSKSCYVLSLKIKYILNGRSIPKEDIAGTLNNLGTVLWRMGDDRRSDKSDDEREKLFRDAKEKYEEALEIRYAIYGREAQHTNIAISLSNIATVLQSMRQYEEAKKYLGKCLKMQRRLFGKDTQNPKIARTHWNISMVYYFIFRATSSHDTATRQTNLRMATAHCERALKILDEAYAYEVCHPSTLDYADGYFRRLDAANNYEALVAFSESRFHRIRDGPTDLDRASARKKWAEKLTDARRKLQRAKRDERKKNKKTSTTKKGRKKKKKK